MKSPQFFRWNRRLWGIGCLIAVISTARAGADDRRGWFITIDRNTAGIVLKLAFEGKPYTNWIEIPPGKGGEFDLPIEYRHAWRVKVLAYSNRKQADFSLSYNYHTVYKWSMDGQPEECDKNQQD